MSIVILLPYTKFLIFESFDLQCLIRANSVHSEPEPNSHSYRYIYMSFDVFPFFLQLIFPRIYFRLERFILYQTLFFPIPSFTFPFIGVDLFDLFLTSIHYIYDSNVIFLPSGMVTSFDSGYRNTSLIPVT